MPKMGKVGSAEIGRSLKSRQMLSPAGIFFLRPLFRGLYSGLHQATQNIQRNLSPHQHGIAESGFS